MGQIRQEHRGIYKMAHPNLFPLLLLAQPILLPLLFPEVWLGSPLEHLQCIHQHFLLCNFSRPNYIRIIFGTLVSPGEGCLNLFLAIKQKNI